MKAYSILVLVRTDADSAGEAVRQIAASLPHAEWEVDRIIEDGRILTRAEVFAAEDAAK